MLALAPVDDLYACPFCRELYAPGEVRTCPTCDIGVKPLAELPPSLEAQALEPEDPTPPEDEVHHWSYLGRARGPLLMVAVFGLGVFFVPWVHAAAPEIRTMSGFEFAQHLPWLWAGGIAWLVMAALVASRRTIRQMRGVRVAVVFLALMVTMTVAARLLVEPTPHRFIPLRYAWGWGLYAAGLLSLLAAFLGTRFGGSLRDMPTHRERDPDATLH